MKSSTSAKIKVSKEIAGVDIEIWIDDSSEFENALILLDNLSDIARVSEAKKKIQHIWDIHKGTAIMNDLVHESYQRVALSLLMVWPKPKGVIDIATETGLTPGAVSNIMTGRRGDTSAWFKREEEGWTLSNEGLSDLMEDIIPQISQISSQPKSEPLY